MKVIYTTKKGEIKEYVYDTKKYYKYQRKVKLPRSQDIVKIRKVKEKKDIQQPVLEQSIIDIIKNKTFNKDDAKDIPGYEDLYAVTRDGYIYSYLKKKFLKPTVNLGGYLQVGLSKDSYIKRLFVHRIVAMTFIPNPNNLPEVNHKNEIKTDCSVDNLEWCTHKYNCNYGTRNQKLSKKVRCVELNKEFDSLSEAAKHFKLDVGNINRACNGVYHSTGGYHWEYVE